jgi:hypothetical protein
MFLSNHKDLRIELEGDATDPILRISGQLLGDEPLPLPASSKLSSVTLDLAGLNRINSMGVRQWDRWMVSIRKSNSNTLIRLLHVPSFFVDLFNIIHEFVPRPYAVESFCVPLYCGECDSSLDFLVERNDAGVLPKSLDELPQIDCDRCRIPLQVDVHSGRSLSFLDRAEKTP